MREPTVPPPPAEVRDVRPMVSVIINVYNEGHLLQDCLESVSWADEIIVTDMHSNDNSADIYRRYTDRVFLIPWEPVAERVHNFGFSKATGEWLLLLDPDERVSTALVSQILTIVNSKATCAAYRLPFKDYIFGKWIRYSGWQGNRQVGLIRLFRRDSVRWLLAVHSQPEIDGEVGSISYDERLDNAIMHVNYTSIEQFMEKLNRYTTAEAEKRFKDGKTFAWPKLIYHPIASFWDRYIRSQGYRDGLHGFILSILMAIYSEVILMKMWDRLRTL